MDEEERQMFRDMLWLNSVIATELIQITENTSAILRDGAIPESCLKEHRELRRVAADIADRYKSGTVLREHLEKHQ